MLHSYFEIDSIQCLPIIQIQFTNVTKIALQCKLIWQNLVHLSIGVDPMFYKDHPQYLRHDQGYRHANMTICEPLRSILPSMHCMHTACPFLAILSIRLTITALQAFIDPIWWHEWMLMDVIFTNRKMVSYSLLMNLLVVLFLAFFMETKSHAKNLPTKTHWRAYENH